MLGALATLSFNWTEHAMIKTLLAAALFVFPFPAAAAPTAADPFTWLEEQNGERAVAWARTRTAAAKKSLGAIPEHPAVVQELKDSLKAAAPPTRYFLLGPKMVRFIRDSKHPSGLLQVAARGPRGVPTPSAWRTVLDIAELNRREQSAYQMNGASLWEFSERCLPPSYDRCMLALSPSGSSSMEFREIDLRAGGFVPGGFRIAANRAFMSWLNADTLLIAHSLEGSLALPSNFPATARLWKRGTPLAKAKAIYQAPQSASFMLPAALGTGKERVGLLPVAHSYTSIDLKLVDQSGTVTDLPLPQMIKFQGPAVLSYPYVIVQLGEATTLAGRSYSAEAILAYDVRRGTPAKHRLSLVHIPQDGAFVTDGSTGFGGTHSGFAFVETKGLKRTLILAKPGNSGWTKRTVRSAEPGVSLSILSTDRNSDDLLVSQEGFLEPATQSLYRKGAAPVIVEAMLPLIDTASHVVEIRSARSKDGTMIDYYLVRPKNAKSPVPTIMAGYGAFGQSFDPGYFSTGPGRGLMPWLKRGGAYVATAIRGGGERGAAWHVGGSGLNKQNAFDDFAAIARDLIDSGFTNPERLGAYGRSGGGMLTAAIANQYPDLFGAIYIGVPVTDMLRRANGIGRGQKSEVGDWDDPKQLPVILAWSPYHNVQSAKPYPKILIMTSTEDNQVGPGHARKFAAKLEQVGARPLLIEVPDGGHGAPDLVRHPDIKAMETSFFIDALMHGTKR